MRAIEITRPGGPEVLELAERPDPVPGPGECLIRVAASGVNRPDVLQRKGAYPPPPGASDLPGLEVAGEIVAGDSQALLAHGLQIGDEVCALANGGGYAERCVVPVGQCLPVPRGWSMAEAATLPETCFTVWSNIVMRGGLQAGERFLVHGGSSGIGTTAIQIAAALGARVWATAGSDEKCAACARLGATAINYREQDFVEALRAEGGADLILDMVGGDYVSRNIRAMADDGRLVFIAFLGGPKVTLNLAPVMMRRLTITGSTLRPQCDLAKARIAEELRAHVWPMIAAGKLRPVMDAEFALEEAAAAHAHMEAGDHIGKIVLRVGE